MVMVAGTRNTQLHLDLHANPKTPEGWRLRSAALDRIEEACRIAGQHAVDAGTKAKKIPMYEEAATLLEVGLRTLKRLVKDDADVIARVEKVRVELHARREARDAREAQAQKAAADAPPPAKAATRAKASKPTKAKANTPKRKAGARPRAR